MNFLRIARTSRALVRPLLGGFQVLACCAATLIAQDSGLKEATFLGLMQNPGVTSGGNPTDSKVKPFMPTIDPASYKALKDAGAASPSGVKPGAGLAALSGPRPLTLSQSFTGIDRFGAADQGFIYTPPDVNTATGNGQVVEVTNNHYTCFDPSGIILQDTPASVFFGYNRQLFTDPRVVYDTIWNRWIVGEVAFPENPTTMIFFLAVSQTPDCTGPFYVYTTNEPLAAGDCYDYPQLGYDQDAIIVTFNVFGPGGCVPSAPLKYGEIDFYAKARVYNGLGLQAPFITGYGATLTPNTGRDSNGTTIVLRNVAGTNQVQLIKLTSTSKSNPSSSTVNVTTPEVCGVPRSANQPGTSAKLDTLDGRFQAPGTQFGSFVWNVQTCGIGSFPIPRVLQININTNTVTQRDFVYASGSSDDFNPSVAVNDFGDVMMNWSSTDVGINASTYAASRPSGGFFTFAGLCFQSATSSTAFRWGDTSGNSVDYTDPTQQSWWISNETIENASNWGTEACLIKRP